MPGLTLILLVMALGIMQGQVQAAAPVVGSAGGTLDFWDGDGASVIDSDLTVSDGDGDNITSATVSIIKAGAAFISGDVLAATTTGTSITASYDASTGVLSLTGSDTAANYQSVFRSVTYNSPSTPSDWSDRTVTWSVTDATSSASAAVTSTITLSQPLRFEVSPDTADSSMDMVLLNLT